MLGGLYVGKQQYNEKESLFSALAEEGIQMEC